MTKLEFLTAFRTACEALPTELTETAIADYERQFTDQLLSGQSEQAIVDRWGTPSHAALKLKLGTLNGNLKEVVSVEKVARVGVSGAGLAVLDLFLIIPATIYLALLTAFYVASMAVYLSGIFVSASSLAGVNDIDVPVNYLFSNYSVKGSTHLDIGNVEIDSTDVSRDPEAAPRLPQGDNLQTHFKRDKTFHIATHITKNSIWRGMSTTLAGMLMLVLCLLATGFTWRLVRRFVTWHFSILKNA